MNRRYFRLAAAALGLGLLATGCGGKTTDAPVSTSSANAASCEASEGRLVLATGDLGTPFFVLGGGLAQLISGNTKLKATGAETGGSLQNIQLLASGSHDVAFAQADIAADAVAGKGSFEGKPQPIRALARLYPQYLQVVVRSDVGIMSVEDLRGKRVSTGAPKSGTEVIAHRLLQAVGFDLENDLHIQRLDLTKAVDGFKSGTVDAIFLSTGVPTAPITDLVTSMKTKVQFLDVTSQLDGMRQINPAYEQAVIPATAYEQSADLPSIVTPTVLLVRENFPANNACAITKVMFDNKAALEKVHPAATEIAVEKAALVDPVVLHPGAKRALDALK
ncbi:TAXI family TRAP transporter solute-binding subunit [Nonomuraea sp. NPDC050790]|uniref:TAXI family TRAP transporter solute-binding subunit n=1 Tax=Nonomuraea sp. NPDC050790 TaxID=3364371 RepID=UPI003792550B